MNPAIYPSLNPFDRKATRQRRSPRSIFLPKEHGSWSLALEPVVFGLLVVPGPASVALALGAVAAFFSRRPFKTTITAPRQDALLTLAMLTTATSGGFALAIIFGSFSAMWPLLPTLPLALLYLYWDRQNENRAVSAELAGSSLFAFIPAAMATLNGHDWRFALSLSAVMLARSAPAVITVRTWLRRRKGRAASLIPAIAVTMLALGSITLLWQTGDTPWVAHALILFSCARLTLLFKSEVHWSAKHVGMAEAAFGILYIVSTSVGFLYLK